MRVGLIDVDGHNYPNIERCTGGFPRKEKPMQSKDYQSLRECPFCGGAAYLEESHRAFIGGKTSRVAFVRCKKCNARSGRFELADYGHTKNSIAANEAAVNAWNRRCAE